jgi:hypothetical protein
MPLGVFSVPYANAPERAHGSEGKALMMQHLTQHGTALQHHLQGARRDCALQMARDTQSETSI